MGARKRARVVGLKENIADAPWLLDSTAPGVTQSADAETQKVEDPKEQEALQFVPRKRTNADHVITPKKPSRQSTLNVRAQIQDLGSDGTTDNVEEKPMRRRKSLRKSLRKSMAMTVLESFTGSEASSSLFGGDAASQEDIRLQTKEEKRPEPRRSLRRSEVVVEASVKTGLDNFAQALVEGPIQDIASITLQVEVQDSPVHKDTENTPTSEDALSQTVKIPLNDHEEQENTITPRSETPPIKEDGFNGSANNCLLEPSVEYESTILPSIELDDGAASIQTPKTIGTPKKRKGAAKTRPATRRSTRTRSSSAKVEQVPTQEDAVSMETRPSTSNSELVDAQQDISEQLSHESSAAGMVSKTSVHANDNAVFQLDEAPRIEESANSTEPEKVQSSSLDSEAISFDLDDVPLAISLVQSERDGSPILEASTTENAFFAVDVVQSNETLSSATSSTPTKVVDVTIQLVDSSIPNFAPDDIDPHSPADEIESDISSTLSDREVSPAVSDEQTLEILESFEPVFVPADQTLSFKIPSNSTEDTHETTAPDPTTSEFVEAISENAQAATYDDHDDTDMLRNFLTRVKANKAAKAEAAPPKRKRSLPHSPLQLPLGADDNTLTLPATDEFDVSVPTASPSKRRKRNAPFEDEDEAPEPKSARRSGRTRLPVVKSPVAAPSFIPVRRLGQDADTTVILIGDGDKEIAAKTRVNTRKNKGTAILPNKLLAKKSREKEDPTLRQRLLKEAFDEKAARKAKSKNHNRVAWAVEIAHFQDGTKKIDSLIDMKETEKEKVSDEKKGGDEKKAAVRTGGRSKLALGTATNGTPAPKRKTRERS